MIRPGLPPQRDGVSEYFQYVHPIPISKPSRKYETQHKMYGNHIVVLYSVRYPILYLYRVYPKVGRHRFGNISNVDIKRRVTIGFRDPFLVRSHHYWENVWNRIYKRRYHHFKIVVPMMSIPIRGYVMENSVCFFVIFVFVVFVVQSFDCGPNLARTHVVQSFFPFYLLVHMF